MTGQTIVSMQGEPPRDGAGLVSVLVPCLGQLEYTRLCVPSLLRHSQPPVELIFLDLGSLDGTAEYLAGVAAAAPVRVEMVRTPTDLGIPQAVQEAVALARGDLLVLLNNDTLVTENWLEQLTALANLDPKIGLVGPMSNAAAADQLVETVPYRIRRRKTPAASTASLPTEPLLDTSAVDQFARQWREEHKGGWMEVDRLGGFCLLVKRAVLTAIGPLPSKDGLDLFDTDTLCWKARQAGFTLALCRDLFIHHFASRTFSGGGPSATA